MSLMDDKALGFQICKSFFFFFFLRLSNKSARGVAQLLLLIYISWENILSTYAGMLG